ncbi:hypothetical protein OG474_26485 [Kribbella sp. NBC_01505]|uniref:hypothetical protein n=1 Tax=Kribbella sp. NBC_01505 TaxID=2903580 RepID=UPI00386407EB
MTSEVVVRERVSDGVELPLGHGDRQVHPERIAERRRIDPALAAAQYAVLLEPLEPGLHGHPHTLASLAGIDTDSVVKAALDLI